MYYCEEMMPYRGIAATQRPGSSRGGSAGEEEEAVAGRCRDGIMMTPSLAADHMELSLVEGKQPESDGQGRLGGRPAGASRRSCGRRGSPPAWSPTRGIVSETGTGRRNLGRHAYVG